MLPNRRKRYPPNWQEIADTCKRNAGWRCQSCKVRHGAERISNRTGNLYRVWLHAAHAQFNDTLNQNPSLKCLCPTCHGRYDYRLRTKGRSASAIERIKHRVRLRARGY